ncbi:MAG: hypothetical protein MRT15_02790 [archaeon YNP-LCB-003-016]|uniref:WD40/YVTN/BNR-like repeat-containing protein n=1 Tax=Candidatus Culexarchaeum yellowstonense TaxID=2928963 RepID=UPI0026E9A043|nr:hypothetical protein [Candidatus Culexarchaeum yellowstonense]MCR6691292.1 hypothetical protein [Candidatus Culexarchaeum yellowstonense]
MKLKLVIKKKIAGKIFHWIEGNKIWASSGYSLYASEDFGNTFKEIAKLNAPTLMKIASYSRLLSRTFRLGVRAMIKLNNGNILAVASGKVYRICNNKIECIFVFSKGIGPLRNGLCQDDEGNIYMGEYFMNDEHRYPVNLFKSEDYGKSWRKILSLKDVRHIHFVQFDPYERKIWVGTGDRDLESKIMVSEDGGESWGIIGCSNQKFRAVSLLFTEEYVYWGTDTPAKQSYIYRYRRKDGKIERLVPVNGPVYYSAKLNDIILFSTGVEGRSEGVSAAWDNYAHIWASRDGIHWQDIGKWEKDRLPYIFGYGRISFPNGNFNDALAFTTECVKNADRTSFIGEIVEE